MEGLWEIGWQKDIKIKRYERKGNDYSKVHCILRDKYVWQQKNKSRYIKFRLTRAILYKLVMIMNYRIIYYYFINFIYVKYLTVNINFQVEPQKPLEQCSDSCI